MLGKYKKKEKEKKSNIKWDDDTSTGHGILQKNNSEIYNMQGKR